MILTLKFILIFANFAGWFALINKFVKNYWQSIVLFQALWITVGFVLNFFGLLLHSFYLFQLIGFISAGYFSFQACREKDFSSLFPKEFLVLFAICFIWFLRTGFAFYSSPDETLNWGIIIKELTLFDGFSPPELTNNAQPVYPNGPAIYQYYFTKFFGYSQGIAILANCCLFTMLCSFLLYTSKKLVSSLLLIVIITIPALYLNPGFGSLYADYIVGASFAALLVVIYQEINHPNRLLIFIPLIFAMAALKQVGLTLSNLTVIFLVYLMFRRKLFHLSYILFIACLLILPQIVDHVWVNEFLAKYVPDIQSKTFLEKFDIATTQIQTEHGLKVTGNFLLAFFTFFFFRSGGVIFTSFILIAFIFIKWNASKKTFDDFKIVFTASIIILLLYAFHRIVLYLSIYVSDHALSVASIKRYLCSILIGILGLVLYLCKKTFLQMSQKHYLSLKKRINLILLIAVIALAGRFYKKPYLILPDDRKLIVNEMNIIYPHLKKGKKVYILPHNFYVGDCFQYHFESTPFAKRTNIQECFSAIGIENQEIHDAADDKLDKFDADNYDILYIPRSDKKLERKLKQEFCGNKIDGNLFVKKENKFVPIQ